MVWETPELEDNDWDILVKPSYTVARDGERIASLKLKDGFCSCYNAFSRVDMRVEVQIPGGVKYYAVDERGQRRPQEDIPEELWLETYLCGVLRAFSYADEQTNRIIGCRRFNPITSTEAEHRFLDAAERLFFKGMPLCLDWTRWQSTQLMDRMATWL